MFPIKDDQPRYSTPFVNGFLITLNILVYLFQSSLDPRSYELFAREFGVVPSHLYAFLAGSPKYPLATILIPYFTSMFLHAGWMHVLGNMWYLYIFGDNIEDYLGHFTYLVFYVLCGLFAMATQVAVYPHSNLPTGPGEESQVDYGTGAMVRDPKTRKYRRTRLLRDSPESSNARARLRRSSSRSALPFSLGIGVLLLNT
jgi:hypothetical protein